MLQPAGELFAEQHPVDRVCHTVFQKHRQHQGRTGKAAGDAVGILLQAGAEAGDQFGFVTVEAVLQGQHIGGLGVQRQPAASVWICPATVMFTKPGITNKSSRLLCQ